MDDLQCRIIRRGNHFIRLDGAGWVLIDGPWFKRFPDPKTHGRYWRVPYFKQELLFRLSEDCPNAPLENEPLMWEAIRYHAGTLLHPSLLNKRYGARGAVRWLVWQMFIDGDELDGLKRRVGKYPGRYHIGWRVCPDGRLPAFLNHVEMVADDYEMDSLMRMGF